MDETNDIAILVMAGIWILHYFTTEKRLKAESLRYIEETLRLSEDERLKADMAFYRKQSQERAQVKNLALYFGALVAISAFFELTGCSLMHD